MKKIHYFLPSIFIAAIIFILSSQQKISISEKTAIDFVIFKSLHMIEYAVFLTCNYRALKNTMLKNSRKAGYIALIFTILYALSDELHQTFVPTREGRLRDIGFDTIGATLALFIIWNLQRIAPKRLILMAKKLEII